MNIYDLNDPVRLKFNFKNRSNADTDPPVVKLEILAPGRSKVTTTYGTDPEIQKDSTGNYHMVVIADAVGQWQYRWEAKDGGNNSMGEQPGQFTVRKPNL